MILSQQPYLHQHWHQLCLRTGNVCAALAKCRRWHTIYWGDWGTKSKNETPSGRIGWVQSRPIHNIVGICKQGAEKWGLKKVSLTTTDQINQQTVAAHIWEDIWPGNKMLPKNWSKWRDDKRSLCQMNTEKDSITCGCGWKVILGGNASRINQWQVLLSKGKLLLELSQMGITNQTHYLKFPLNRVSWQARYAYLLTSDSQ